MKSLTPKLHKMAVIFIAPALLIFIGKNRKRFLPIVFIGLLLGGCYKDFYKTNTLNKPSADQIDKLKTEYKIYIGHFYDSLVALQDVKATGEAMEAQIRPLSEELSNSLYLQNKHPQRYKPNKDPKLVLQVHLYSNQRINSFRIDSSQKVSIPLSAINQLDIYERDQKKTTIHHVGTTALILGLIIGGVALICNCPQVYVQESNELNFKSGLYSGAVNSNLERSDYLLLDNFPPLSDSLQLRIENVQGEEQFINRLQLLKVKHPQGTKVLADKKGNTYSFTTPVTPLSVQDITGKEYGNQLRFMDGENAGFVQPGKEGEASSLVLQFPAKMAGNKVRLILRAVNTPWSGYVYKEFQGLYGNAYTSMRDNQEKMDRSVAENWIISQSLPLKVYVENAQGGWQFADYFQMPGNSARRDMIMELDIPNTPLQTTRIKLETVYRFWEIDYAALDNTQQAGIENKYIDPTSALLSTGENMVNQISRTDKAYLTLTGKKHLNLHFSQLKEDSENSTYFLSGSGYYHQSPVKAGNPDVARLSKFKNPGAFQSFSLDEYEKINTELVNLMENGHNRKTKNTENRQ